MKRFLVRFSWNMRYKQWLRDRITVDFEKRGAKTNKAWTREQNPQPEPDYMFVPPLHKTGPIGRYYRLYFGRKHAFKNNLLKSKRAAIREKLI